MEEKSPEFPSSSLPQREDFECPSEEMTIRSCEIWNALPEEIKHDPILASFREGYKQHCGQITDDTDSNLSIPKEDKPLGTAPVPLKVAVISKFLPYIRYVKLSVVVGVWMFFTVILMYKHEHSINSMHQISVPENNVRNILFNYYVLFYWIMHPPNMHHISVELEGAILPHYYGNISQKWLTVWIELIQTGKTNSSKADDKDVFYSQKITSDWLVPLVPEDLLEYDVIPEVRQRHTFHFINFDKSLSSQSNLRLRFKTNLAASFPVAISYDLWPINPSVGVVYATLVLIGLYVIIIFEIIHRTVAAVSAAVISIAILAVFNERPTKMELASWLDIESLLLLASMMVIVAILSKSGIFDYVAVIAFKKTHGKVWPLVNTLCFFTAMISSLLDSVTTALLMTPVTIRLCEVMKLNPVPILIAMIMYSNIGGAITPVGDPPNVILAMNDDVNKAGINFITFVMHMGLPLIIIMLCVNLQLRFMLNAKFKVEQIRNSREIEDLEHVINIWCRAFNSLSSYTEAEDAVKSTLSQKVELLVDELKLKKSEIDSNRSIRHIVTSEVLKNQYPIRDKWLLFKSSVCLLFVIIMFFLHSIPEPNLSMGWAAFLGALLLLLMADEENVEGVLAGIEWSTLVFFGALFIMMEALSRLGFIEWIGSQTEEMILSIDEEYRLAAALPLILWVSGLASSFVDNIPLTTMMVKIITRLSQKEGLELPLPPLVWALALGACLGGNGTLIGASSNVVCAGVAEQHGYRFTFMEFLRMGFPVTLLSMTVATVYLMVVHVWFQWHL